MNVVPFKAEHFWSIEAQPAQAYVKNWVTEADIKALENQDTFTLFDGDEILACFGWMQIYSHRATVWSIICKNPGPRFVAMTRIAKRLIEGLPYQRLELDVDCGFEEGHRWAKMLGFTLEAERLRGFRMDGGDSAVYARIR